MSEQIRQTSGVRLEDLGVPRWTQDLVVLDVLDITVEEATFTTTIDDQPVSLLRVPLIDLEFPDASSAHDAVLSAMGYGEAA